MMMLMMDGGETDENFDDEDDVHITVNTHKQNQV